MERWRGRTALVTGASSGIGYSIAEQLAKNGMNVIGCARRAEKIEELAQKCAACTPGKDCSQGGCGEITTVKCDLTNEEEVLQMFQRIEKDFKHVDILVNNAAMLTEDDLMTGETKGWKKTLDLNVLALSICTREALRLMFKDNVDDGHVININSIAGHMNSAPGTSMFDFYIGTKHMVTALTKALNAELRQKKTKIRVTSISPGTVRTEIWDHLENIENKEMSPETQRTMEEIKSIQILEAKDIADSVLYVIGVPPHVNIRELIVAPTEQSMQ
ncbi:hypothetical protein RvY_16467 [Ramazzottius varieornatus]|uniref:Dehydrogenase/reductase SDR family member 11 n=1 Tax=Ramazzottius varieornatus TaxID=947166 RepID=A0A1D1VYJ6_RAMVA|nr:hypothetical protein RvY_16467 [Ramazzottius varieornatus]